MADETIVEAKSKDDLLASMKKAVDSGEWKEVSKISALIAKSVSAEEKAEKEARQAELEGITKNVKSVLDKAIKTMADKGELDLADGVWYVNDFGETLTSCRLMKSVAKAKGAGGGGGTGKKFNITTNELLTKHGGELMKDSDKTYQQAYDENKDGNSRYNLRVKLLKLEGMS